VGCFLFEDEFWCRFRKKFIRVLAKNGFCNAKFLEFGSWWGWGDHFWTKPLNGTSLAHDFTRFEPLFVQIRLRVFPPGVCTKKRTLQKVTDMLYFTYLRGIPHSTKFN